MQRNGIQGQSTILRAWVPVLSRTHPFWDDRRIANTLTHIDALVEVCVHVSRVVRAAD
jgi:hypothetical protein